MPDDQDDESFQEVAEELRKKVSETLHEEAGVREAMKNTEKNYEDEPEPEESAKEIGRDAEEKSEEVRGKYEELKGKISEDGPIDLDTIEFVDKELSQKEVKEFVRDVSEGVIEDGKDLIEYINNMNEQAKYNLDNNLGERAKASREIAKAYDEVLDEDSDNIKERLHEEDDNEDRGDFPGSINDVLNKDAELKYDEFRSEIKAIKEELEEGKEEIRDEYLGQIENLIDHLDNVYQDIENEDYNNGTGHGDNSYEGGGNENYEEEGSGEPELTEEDLDRKLSEDEEPQEKRPQEKLIDDLLGAYEKRKDGISTHEKKNMHDPETGFTYEAKCGAEIDYLKDQGWEEAGELVFEYDDSKTEGVPEEERYEIMGRQILRDENNVGYAREKIDEHFDDADDEVYEQLKEIELQNQARKTVLDHLDKKMSG